MKCNSKKMANGGMVMPAQSNKGGAMRGKERAAAMSGRTFADGGKVGKAKGKPFMKGGMAKGKKC